jgi:hypothetical protein
VTPEERNIYLDAILEEDKKDDDVTLLKKSAAWVDATASDHGMDQEALAHCLQTGALLMSLVYDPDPQPPGDVTLTINNITFALFQLGYQTAKQERRASSRTLQFIKSIRKFIKL